MAYSQETTPEAALKALALDCTLPVVKLGSRGACVMRNGESIFVSAHRVPVIDTTGAGDYFAAGFLYALGRDAELSRCLSLGTSLGEAVIQRMGTSLSADEWTRLQQEALKILA